ncbi:MAG: Maf family protein [Wujia sp.]
MYKIILASQSPRRRELMTLAGFHFSVIPSNKDEVITGIIPSDVVCELSSQKAWAVFEEYMAAGNEAGITDNTTEEESAMPIVIGADTVVSVDGKILGKPRDEQDAFDMIKLLQGRTHEVYTGVTIVKSKEESNTFYECTGVTFYPMTDEEIWSYIREEGFAWRDKAGAYGIQDSFGAKYIEKIEGDYYNVVGLPIARLFHELGKMELGQFI